MKKSFTSILFILCTLLYYTALFVSHNRWVVPGQIVFFLLPSLLVVFACGQTDILSTRVERRVWLKVFLIAVLATACLNGLEQVWHLWFPLPEAYTQELKAMLHLGQRYGIVLDLLARAVVPAVAEEFFFRGFLQSVLLKSARPWVAVSLSSLIFGAYHLNPVLFPFYVVLGGVLGWFVFKTKSIWPSVVSHLIVNGFGVGMIYVVGRV